MDDAGSIIEKIRKHVFAEAQEALAGGSFQRWRYSLYNARMADADASACVKGSSGETMEMYLKITNNRVERASYITDGGNLSSLCGTYAAEITIGMRVQQVLEIKTVDVLRRAGRAGREAELCARCAVEALQAAVDRYRLRCEGQAEPGNTMGAQVRFVARQSNSKHLRYIN